MTDIRDCSHCWHITSMYHATDGEHRNFICCHCSMTKHEHTPVVSEGHTYTPLEHGPFAPESIVQYMSESDVEPSDLPVYSPTSN